jgi:hypothetical protein
MFLVFLIGVCPFFSHLVANTETEEPKFSLFCTFHLPYPHPLLLMILFQPHWTAGPYLFLTFSAERTSTFDTQFALQASKLLYCTELDVLSAKTENVYENLFDLERSQTFCHYSV